VFGIISALRRRRLARRPFPASWLSYLHDDVPFFEHFGEADREKFLRDLKVFVWEKVFVAAGGMVVDDEVKVVVAASAVRLVLRLDLSYYDRLTEIVIYPSHYHHPGQTDDVVFGEAHPWGVVVLSWEAVLSGLKNPHDGHDTAAHEFAHVLDRAGGAFDGTPELRAYGHYRAWAQVMQDHYDRLRARERHEREALRPYGAQNEAEFFAVATESFFEKPRQLKKYTPDLYDELRRFYGFDPDGEPRK